MAAKTLFIFFASALLVQNISGQCIGAANSIAGTALIAEELAQAGNALAYGPNIAGGPGLATAPLAYPGAPALGNCGLAANSIVPSNGGGFAVTSSSPIAPTGITIYSQNAIEGALAVNGELPFLGAVALEGALPTAGAGGINYGCGNGAVGIVSEGIAPAGGPLGPAAGAAAGRFGFGAGLAGPGLNGLGLAGQGLAGPGLAGLAAPGLSATGLGFNGLPGGCGYGAAY